MKRSWKKSVDKLSRDMVGSIINKELIDITKGDRELNDDRILWLLDFSVASATNIYTTNNRHNEGVQFFKNCATNHAKKYLYVLKNTLKEGKFVVHLPNANSSAVDVDGDKVP